MTDHNEPHEAIATQESRLAFHCQTEDSKHQRSRLRWMHCFDVLAAVRPELIEIFLSVTEDELACVCEEAPPPWRLIQLTPPTAK